MSVSNYCYKFKHSQCLYCSKYSSCMIINPVQNCFIIDNQFVYPLEVVSFCRNYKGFPDNFVTDSILNVINEFNVSINHYLVDERLKLYDS